MPSTIPASRSDALNARPAPLGRRKPPMRKARENAQRVCIRAHSRSGACPWSEKQLGLYKVIFSRMANWLPEEEAASLRREFAAEVARLEAAGR
jgi:hypothetical protein